MKTFINHPSFNILLATLLILNTFSVFHLYGNTQKIQTDLNLNSEAYSNVQQKLQDEQQAINHHLESIQHELELSQRAFQSLQEEAEALKEENQELKKKLL